MLVYLVLVLISLVNSEILSKPEAIRDKACNGTNARMYVPSNRTQHYQNLKERYTDCAYVEGNLEITWIQDKEADLSFLNDIQEVTGYVLISHVDVPKIVLPSLQAIHGQTRFHLKSPENREFALLISLTRSDNIELPVLREILAGDVGVLNNFNLCHLNTINWEEIMNDRNAKYVYAYNFTLPPRECPSCDSKCEAGCWGEGIKNCQKFSKINCSPQCDGGRCYGPNPRQCCHLSCNGGCTGPRITDCLGIITEVYAGPCTGPAIVDENDKVLQCLDKDELCPIGYYSDSIRQSSPRALMPACRKCHPRCKQCSAYGFHEQVCQECTFFKRGQQCGIEGECVKDFYFLDTERHECLPCPNECETCNGPADSDCVACRNCQA